MMQLYAQASNTFNTSQMYQKWWGDVILGNSGRYCSVYKLQDKTEHELIKTITLIHSLSHFNSEGSFGGKSPQSVPREWILGPLCLQAVNLRIFVWYE